MARVLIIEDNPESLALMQYLLRAFGHDTVTAQNGEEGLERAATTRGLDLIVCDVHLPKLDGCEVAQRLKAHPTLHRLHLVAVTALAMVGDRERVLAAGFDGYIAKPIAPREFVGQVEAFLPAVAANPHGRPPAPRAPPALMPPHPPGAAIGARILVVDDSPTNRNLARATLAPFGYQLTLATGVAEARALLARQPFDLILADLHMPEEDGFHLLAAVKAMPRLRTIPFVLISASVWGSADRKHGLALGATRFLLRPIEPRRLLEEVQSCLASQPP